MFGRKDSQEEKAQEKKPEQDAAKQEAQTPSEQNPPGPEEEIAHLKDELEAAKDKYYRLFAEFDNVRKRNERERQELIKYAHEEVIVELLGFFEDFERCITAAKANPEGTATLLKGVEMVYSRMQQLLKKYDVGEIDAAGKKFDHTVHEAMMAVDSVDHEEGTVLEVFQKGYTLGGRVVRTAKVKVSRKPGENQRQENQ